MNVANLQHESATVTLHPAGQLHIAVLQYWDDGMTLGGTLRCHIDAAHWLADQLDAAADNQPIVERATDVGRDRLTVYVGGSDWQPFVHVLGDPPSAGEVSMTVATAMTVATQLRAAGRSMCA